MNENSLNVILLISFDPVYAILEKDFHRKFFIDFDLNLIKLKFLPNPNSYHNLKPLKSKRKMR